VRVQGQSVLISGIGIAGTTLAYWLGKHGFKPTLVERASHLRTSGYVIDFWGLGYDIAERMGLLSGLKSDGYDVQEVRFVNAKGRRVGGFGVDIFRSLTDGRYVSIARSDLAKLIYHKIDGQSETIFGDSIVGIKDTGEDVGVVFERSAPRRFDLVIGADGLHSAVREVVFGSQNRFEKFLGYTVAAFEIKGYRLRDERVYVSHGVPGKQVSRFPMRDDRTLFLFVFADGSDQHTAVHDMTGHKDILHKEFDNVGWECPTILAALDASDDVYFDRVSQIKMNVWSRGRVALVGDAAFCPSLLAGQGAALAMISAYVVAGELGKSERRPEVAFRRYEQLLRPFMTAKQGVAERFASSFAPKTQLGLFLRNKVMNAFALPFVANRALSGLLDRIELPDYLTQYCNGMDEARRTG
jgi:2-polyprenyl-6-methoxyphenol hydroxylase-like FAD-dependent oxidoreductase